jgi:hypothetical protein
MDRPFVFLYLGRPPIASFYIRYINRRAQTGQTKVGYSLEEAGPTF